MPKNNAAIKLLRTYQEKVKNILPDMYASFAIALKNSGFNNSKIEEVLELSQAVWDIAANEGVDLIPWAEEETGIDLHTFDVGKAKINKGGTEQ